MAAVRDECGTELTEIGVIVEGDVLVALAPDGSRSPLPELGWDHFG
jgi:hypothetical protein